jgi:thiosulfate dehydrogenase
MNNRMKNSIYGILSLFTFAKCTHSQIESENKVEKKDSLKLNSITSIWEVPDTSRIPKDEFGDLIKYGRNLVLNTAYYIGPEGKVGKYLGNKMNCTNCHLEAGTKPYAFNFFSTHARYPQYRARENKVLTLGDRINNCIERPHNGKHLPLDSKEIIAISSYIKWLGSKVPVNEHVEGDTPLNLAFPNRSADPVKGEEIYKRDCSSCHGKNGRGKMRKNNVSYEYPPLWGDSSYQAGSSVHRLVKLSAFVYANMPHKIANYNNPQLTVEEAYDVCAFINNDLIHKRPSAVTKKDYSNTKYKPIDYYKGPYLDTFSEQQHKYGPYKPIIDYYNSKGFKINF